MSDRDITRALMEQLERHYLNPNDRLPAGVFLPEVSWNGYGGNTSRCDALFVGFTSASGRLLVGHEVKASRADWLAELRKTGKADSWADQCHQWWLVTIPGVVADGELPNGWGLLVPGGRSRMKVVTPASTRADLVPSWDASRSIIARLNTLHRNTIADALKRGREQQEGEFEGRVRREVAFRMEKVRGSEALQKLVDRYEKALEGHLVDGDRAYGRDYTEQDLAAAGAWLAARRDLRRYGGFLAGGQQLAAAQRTLDQAVEALRQLVDLEKSVQQLSEGISRIA